MPGRDDDDVPGAFTACIEAGLYRVDDLDVVDTVGIEMHMSERLVIGVVFDDEHRDVHCGACTLRPSVLLPLARSRTPLPDLPARAAPVALGSSGGTT